MASDRIRSKSTIGTRLSSLETAAENAAKSDNVGELSVLNSRVSKLESLSKDLSSFNWRLEQEYPSMDERYVLAGGGGGSSTQITDWNLATEPGNYWSYEGGTINGPVSAWLVGVVEDFGSGGNQVRVQSVYIANASEGQSGYGTVWRRYYNVSTGTFTTTWAPLMPPPHTHPWSQITDPLVNMGGDVDASVVPSGFPDGVSLRTAGTGFPASVGLVVTERHSGYHQVQWFYDRSAVARAWFRTADGDSAWQAWREVITDASAAPAAPDPVFGVLSSLTAQTIPNNASTTVTMTDSSLSGGMGVLTDALVVPVSGWYRVQGATEFRSAGNNTGYRQVSFNISPFNLTAGARLSALRIPAQIGVPTVVQGYTVVELVAGSKVSLRATHNQGGQVYIDRSQISVELIK